MSANTNSSKAVTGLGVVGLIVLVLVGIGIAVKAFS